MADKPDEAYGRVTNPERFEPLIAAAADVVVALQQTFEVSVTRTRPPQNAQSSRVERVEVVQVVPARTDQAPLTITTTSLPGVYLDLGAWEHVALPSCGCDACDEDAQSMLAELARYCEALTAGQLSEQITGGTAPTLRLAWKAASWGRSSTSPLSVSKIAELKARSVQAPADGQWKPWSRRLPTNRTDSNAGADQAVRPCHSSNTVVRHYEGSD